MYESKYNNQIFGSTDSEPNFLILPEWEKHF